MSNNAAEVSEKEIILEEVHEPKTEEVSKDIDKDTPIKHVDRKNVNQLTAEERQTIIDNAKNGVDQPNFEVTFFKNGNYRIIKKKQQRPSVSQKIINQQLPTSSNTPSYYTDNQLLYEHIIELTARMEQLTAKHKKLKNRYKELQQDLYIDDNTEEPVNKEFNEETNNEPVQRFGEPQQANQQQLPINHSRKISWRNQIAYL